MKTSVARSPGPLLAPRLASRLTGALLAGAAFAGLAAWLQHYSLDRGLAGALLAGYVALLLARPTLWLALLPALWPVIDLSPWSGQIYVTESDALALATLFALGLREAAAPPPGALDGPAPVRLNLVALGVFGLLAASVTASGIHGLLPLPPLAEAATLIDYTSRFNALRVAKGFVLAFALIPFLHLALRREGDAALRRFTLGLTLGLAVCAVATLWERVAFPGFTNFASDYRSSGLFWEMHVGGAALDAWLMLTFPFALNSLAKARSPLARSLALLAIGLGAYAIFTTFSRIVYGAVLVAMGVLGLYALRRAPDAEHAARAVQASRGRPGVLMVLGALVLGACFLTFRDGGYRGMAAFAGLALLAWPGGGALAGARPGQLLAGLLSGLILVLVSLLATLWLPKGIYGIYALSWAATAVVLWQASRRLPSAAALTAALLVWTAANAVGICMFWSATPAPPGALLAAALVLGTVALQALRATPLWRPRGEDLYALGALLAIGGMLAASLGGSFMGDRLSATSDDARDRFSHYRESTSLVRGLHDTLLGVGLGRFADAFFWLPPAEGFPGSVSLRADAQGRYVQLGGAHYSRGYGEMLRLSQRLPLDSLTPFRYRLRARSTENTALALSVCRKHLLYPEGCSSWNVPIVGGAGWQPIEGISRGELAGSGWPPKFAVFSIGVDGAANVDIDELELSDAALRPLLRNGGFEQGTDAWFFTSDRNHLPWHAKNMAVHLYVEQGLFGLAVVGLAFLAAAVRLLRPRPHPLAATVLAALAGVGVVGLVDSLFDMPRLTFFICLLLWLGLTLRRPAAPPALSAAAPQPSSGRPA